MKWRKKQLAVLVLENGDYYIGNYFGEPKKVLGEVCFNTSMTGYQEILTDPSYYGQIVVMTYPMIGNYGIHESYSQSDRIQCRGLVVKQYVRRPSNFVSQMTLDEFLKRDRIPGLEKIDTRKLVLTLRKEGVMRGGIFPEYDSFRDFMLDEVVSICPMKGLDLVSKVTVQTSYRFSKGGNKRFRIAVYDYGVKRSILTYLDEAGFDVYVFPSFYSPESLKHFDCFFLSNGPGDPSAIHYAIENVKTILEFRKPILGICLGHQILGLARGWNTFKLKFGHRGGNQPVRDIRTGKVEITAQNHGFAVQTEDKKDLQRKRNTWKLLLSGGQTEDEKDLQVIYVNLNDQTIEGFRDRHFPILSVQHHPEASPGPHDAKHIFKDFYQMVEEYYTI